MNRSIDRKEPSVTVELDPKTYHEDAVLAAAHVLARRAEVWLEGRSATLKPKPPLGESDLEALADEFVEEAVAQELRRRIAEGGRTVREYIVMQALLSAAGPQVQPTQTQLPPMSADQESEIASLIREAEQEIREQQQIGRMKPELPSGEAVGGDDRPMDPAKILELLDKADGKP